jgi:sulfofructose kinase
MANLAFVGISVHDMIFKIPVLPLSEGKYPATNFFEEGGGPAATAAVTAAVIGTNSFLISRVGSDYRGSLIIDELKKYGVNVVNIKKIEGALSSVSAVLVSENGERIISNYLDPHLIDDPSWITDEMLKDKNLVLADVRWVKGALKAFSISNKYQITTVLDADVTTSDITELLLLTDHCIFSKQGIVNLTGIPDIINGLFKADKLTKGIVYATDGEKGCYWIENGVLKHFPGYKVKVLDTTGAGDVFHGAFALSISENSNIGKAIQFASATAAIKCTKSGTRKGIPTRKEINRFIELNHN